MASTAIAQLGPSSSKASDAWREQGSQVGFQKPKESGAHQTEIQQVLHYTGNFCHLTPVLNLGNELLFLLQVENQASSHIYTNSFKKSEFHFSNRFRKVIREKEEQIFMTQRV